MMTLALAEDRRLLRENKQRGHGEWWKPPMEQMDSSVAHQVTEILMGQEILRTQNSIDKTVRVQDTGNTLNLLYASSTYNSTCESSDSALPALHTSVVRKGWFRNSEELFFFLTMCHTSCFPFRNIP